MNSERRKNYRWGITPGEWMQAAGILTILLVSTLAVYSRAESAFKQVDENKVSIEATARSQKRALNDLRLELKQDIKESEERLRTDIRELRALLLREGRRNGN